MASTVTPSIELIATDTDTNFIVTQAKLIKRLSHFSVARVEFLLETTCPTNTLLGQQVRLRIETRFFYGIIFEITCKHSPKTINRYIATVRSPFAKLMLQQRNHYWGVMTVSQIWEKLLAQQNLPPIQVTSQKIDEKAHPLIQYQQNDMAFLQTVSAQYGYIFWEQHHEGGYSLHLSSENKGSVKPPIKSNKISLLNGYVSNMANNQAHIHYAFEQQPQNTRSLHSKSNRFFASKNQGTLLKLQKKQEVMLGFIDNDMTKTIALGQCYNKKTPPKPHITAQSLVSDHFKLTQHTHHLTMLKSQCPITFLAKNHLLQQAKQLDLVAKNKVTTQAKQNALMQAKSITLRVQQSKVTVTNDRIKITAPKIRLCTPDGVNQPLARLGDMHRCLQAYGDGSPHHGGKVLSGSPKLFIEGKAAALKGHPTQCRRNIDPIQSGIASIKVEGVATTYHLAATTHGGYIQQAATHVISCRNNRSTTEAKQAVATKNNVSPYLEYQLKWAISDNPLAPCYPDGTLVEVKRVKDSLHFFSSRGINLYDIQPTDIGNSLLLHVKSKE